MKTPKTSHTGTKRKHIAAASAIVLGVSALGLSTQAQQANQRVQRKIEGVTRSQTARKAQDSPQTRKAKDTQRLKTAQSATTLNRSGVWNVDPAHSSVGFSVRHVGINHVKGTFNDFEGTITGVEGDLAKSSVRFSAKVASIDTEIKQRDDHLRSPDFFDVEKYPTLSFQSKKVEKIAGEEMYRVTGDLTMRGVTKSISFPFQLFGPAVDGFGYTRGGIEANLTLNRQDYGVKWSQTLDNGNLAVDNIVRVSLNLEAVKSGSGPKPASPKPAA
jgi:polyisoprenoid-binding protein YceI